MRWKNIMFKKENKIGFVILNRPEAAQRLKAFLEKKR
jgi:hypothetical protein